MIALALTLLPNLTSLEVQPYHDSNYLITKTIRRIAEAKSFGGPLAKLISVTICPSADSAFTDSTSLINPNPIEVFATLPSVKIINVKRIHGDRDKLEDLMPLVQSNVTDLNISDGDISPTRLMLLLQGFQSLHSFTYRPAMEYADYSFDAFPSVANLLLCAQDSLRELQLRAGTGNPGYMGSLR